MADCVAVAALLHPAHRMMMRNYNSKSTSIRKCGLIIASRWPLVISGHRLSRIGTEMLRPFLRLKSEEMVKIILTSLPRLGSSSQFFIRFCLVVVWSWLVSFFQHTATTTTTVTEEQITKEAVMMMMMLVSLKKKPPASQQEGRKRSRTVEWMLDTQIQCECASDLPGQLLLRSPPWIGILFWT